MVVALTSGLTHQSCSSKEDIVWNGFIEEAFASPCQVIVGDGSCVRCHKITIGIFDRFMVLFIRLS